MDVLNLTKGWIKQQFQTSGFLFKADKNNPESIILSRHVISHIWHVIQNKSTTTQKKKKAARICQDVNILLNYASSYHLQTGQTRLTLFVVFSSDKHGLGTIGESVPLLHLPGHLHRSRLHPVWTQLLPGLHRRLLGHEGQVGVSAVQRDVQRATGAEDQPSFFRHDWILQKVCFASRPFVSQSQCLYCHCTSATKVRAVMYGVKNK